MRRQLRAPVLGVAGRFDQAGTALLDAVAGYVQRDGVGAYHLQLMQDALRDVERASRARTSI